LDATGDAGHNRSPEEVSRRYTAYLIVVALEVWSLASYDLNLLVLTIRDSDLAVSF
jgi:hypothetical protein